MKKFVSAEKVAKRIRSIRGKRSQEEFEAITGIDQGRISRYERGTVPNPENLVKIARAGNVSVDWLLTGKLSLRTDRGSSTNPVPEKSAAPIAANQ